MTNPFLLSQINGTFPLPWTALVTLLTLLVYFVFAYRVGVLRAKHGVKAPSMEGPLEFMQAVRVQLNTAEQLWLFIPTLWLSALLINDIFAAMVGLFWPISRLLYAIGYSHKEVARRFPGFLLGMLVIAILFCSALSALLTQMLLA